VDQCGLANYPVVFTRLNHPEVLDFIISSIKMGKVILDGALQTIYNMYTFSVYACINSNLMFQHFIVYFPEGKSLSFSILAHETKDGKKLDCY
jgi:hypothetical protein